jgi:hypothetical protein
MHTPDGPSDSQRSDLLSARNLSVVALVLFVLFGTVVAGVILPFQPLDSAWQLRLAAALINGASFPLVGLALLHLATGLDSSDRLLRARWRRCSRLAVIVALGFLLLIPLLGVAGLRESHAISNAQTSRISGAERKLSSLRQAVAVARSSGDLNRRLQRLDGPVLGPADIAQPLPLLKAQVGAVLDQAQLQIAQERQALPPANPYRLLPDLIRNTIACLALAMGFATLAVRPGSESSLLEEVQMRWLNARLRLRHRRRQSGKSQTELDYMGEINTEVDPE